MALAEIAPVPLVSNALLAVVVANFESAIAAPDATLAFTTASDASSSAPTASSANIEFSTDPACIVAEPVTFPEPVKDADVQTTSPVIPIVLPVASAVAVSAFPVTSPVTAPSSAATIVPTVPETTSEESVASGINVSFAAESSNPRNAVFALPE